MWQMSRLSVGMFAALVSVGAAMASPSDSGGLRGYDVGPGMMWSGGAWGGFGMILGPVFMILVVVAIVAAIAFVLRSAGLIWTAPPPAAGGDRARDLLRERFARGEIDAREYDERKRLLE